MIRKQNQKTPHHTQQLTRTKEKEHLAENQQGTKNTHLYYFLRERKALERGLLIRPLESCIVVFVQ
jgi:hypothetical protein